MTRPLHQCQPDFPHEFAGFFACKDCRYYRPNGRGQCALVKRKVDLPDSTPACKKYEGKGPL